MRTHVALLRGVNVGGHNRVAMADLRSVVASLGHQDVLTYIQSGNVVFTSQLKDTTAIASALQRQITASLPIEPRVVVLSHAELAAVVTANPFPDERDGKRLHAGFRMGEIGSDELRGVAAAEQRARDKGSRDEAIVVGRTLYLHTPDGLGRSVLATELTRAGPTAVPSSAMTLRNWATLTKLLSLLT